MTKLLVVGTGTMGSRHIRLAKKIIPDVQIMALQRRVNSKKLDEIDWSVDSLQEALNFQPDFAIIATPSSEHLKTALSLAENKIDLLVEKPLTNNIFSAIALTTISSTNKILLRTAYNLRFLDSLIFFRELCGEAVLGRKISIFSRVGQFLPEWRPQQDYRKSVSARKELGGGVLHELSHELDYLRWVFGEVEWVRSTLSQISGLEINVEDSALLTMGIRDSKDGSDLIATLSMDFYRHDPIRTCEVVCEKGTILWDCIANEVRMYSAKTKKWEVVFSGKKTMNDTYESQILSFTGVAIPKVRHTSVETNGLRVMEIIEAARVSSPTGMQTKVQINRIN